MATTQIQTSELDFDQLVTSLKAYLENHADLQDADFDGSVLSQLVDLFAYNTHQTALIANFALNEAFLDSAQLRSSLVSHARPLGYTPNSKTGATATVDVTALAVPSGTATLTMDQYTEFTATIDDVAYTFVNLDEETATEAAGYIFEDIVLTQGNVITKKFFVDNTTDDYPIYVIPDDNIDTDTMSVIVRAGPSSTSIETYELVSEVAEIDAASLIYFLHESPRGYYELAFGEGVAGKRPAAGSVVEVTYLSTKGADANNATTFATSAQIDTYSLSVATVSNAAGGAAKETNESIRFNAPLLRTTQNRLVTVSDYSSFITNNISNIESLNVWGGEDNDPVNYGHVYIAANTTGAVNLTDSEKAILEALIRKKSVIDLRPVFEDPDTAYLNVTASLTFDSSKTSLSSAQVATVMETQISDFGTTNLTDFDSTFYLSALTTDMDDYSAAILGSDASVNFQLRLSPTLGSTDTYTLYTVSGIMAPANVTGNVVTSTGFSTVVNGMTATAYIRNKQGTTTLEMYYLSGTTEVIISNVGSLDATAGSLTVGPFTPTALIDATKGIQFTITPADDSVIKPLRNLLLQIDTDETKVVATAQTAS